MTEVFIIGCGFAGSSAASYLCRFRREFRVTVADKGRYFNFLPLLPDCLGRGVPPDALTYPIQRWAGKQGFSFLNEEVESVDLAGKRVCLPSGSRQYDYLIIASGSETNFYGNEDLRRAACTLDNAQDAARLTQLLERGTYSAYVIAGGGYTGIEIATNLGVRFLAKKAPPRIIVVERAPSILGPLPGWMKSYVSLNLRRLNIETALETTVEKADAKRVTLSDGRVIEEALCIWAAGVKTAAYIQKLDLPKNPQGRLRVDEYLRVCPDCFAAGDAAYVTAGAPAGQPLRMAVQFSICEGASAAVNVVRSARGRPLLRYRPRDLGYVIPMANNASCGVVMGVAVRGKVATSLHYAMCAYRLRGIRNKLTLAAAFFKGGAKMGTDIALLVLRLGVGVMFFAHGLQVAFGKFQGPGVANFAKMLEGLGFWFPLFWAYVCACTMLVGGALVVAGLFSRLASAALFVFIAVAAWKVHLSHGFFLQQGGFEYNFLIACACLALVIAGPGGISISRRF